MRGDSKTEATRQFVGELRNLVGGRGGSREMVRGESRESPERVWGGSWSGPGGVRRGGSGRAGNKKSGPLLCGNPRRVSMDRLVFSIKMFWS